MKIEQTQNLPQPLHAKFKRLKYFVLSLYIFLPFIGFWVGMEYQKSNTPYLSQFYPNSSVFRSKEQCEQTTGTICIDKQCDYNCPKDFQKGWIATDQSMVQITPAPDEITNWKTYTNEEYGFEFRYPGEWVYEITNTKAGAFSLGLIPKDIREADYSASYAVHVMVYNSTSIDEHINSYFCPQNTDCAGQSIETELDGNYAKAVTLPFSNFKIRRIISKKGVDVFELSAEINESYKKLYSYPENIEETFNQILSTFRFLEDNNDYAYCESTSECTVYSVSNCCGLAPINKEHLNQVENIPQICTRVCPEFKVECVNNTCQLLSDK